METCYDRCSNDHNLKCVKAGSCLECHRMEARWARKWMDYRPIDDAVHMLKPITA